MNLEKKIEFIAKQLFEKGDTEIVDTVFDSKYIAHDGDKVYKGQEFVIQFITKLRSAIPDIKIQKIEFLSVADNVLTWQRTFNGTHKKDIQGIPASGEKLKWNEIVVTRFEEDKIVEDWVISNLALQLMIKQTKRK